MPDIAKPVPAPPAAHAANQESKVAVLAAMGANLLIAIGKLVAGLMTGSAALLAEAGHSLADTVNQVFLLVGINLSMLWDHRNSRISTISLVFL